MIYVLCRSPNFIPVSPQSHSINLYYVIVLPSFVFNFPHVLYDSHRVQYPSLQKRPLPLPSFVCLISNFSMCTFVLFCFYNPIHHCNHHHNPSCPPCLLCNPFFIIRLVDCQITHPHPLCIFICHYQKIVLLLHSDFCVDTYFPDELASHLPIFY